MEKDALPNINDLPSNVGQKPKKKLSPQSVIDAYQDMVPTPQVGQYAPHPYEASVPVNEELKKDTQGLQPRAREPFERVASERAKKYIDYYSLSHLTMHKGKTHIPKEWIPEGYVGMWARESCRGRPDSNNLQELENVHGWEPLPAEMCPQLSYYDDTGTIDDGATKVRRGGLLLMIREEAIHQAQLKQMARARDADKRMEQSMRTTDGDLHPFSNHSTDNNEMFFPSDDMSRSFASSFSY